MHVHLLIDTTAGDAGYRHYADILARLMGFNAAAAPLAPATATAAPPAPPSAPIPAAPGGAPAAAPSIPAPPSAPASASPPIPPTHQVMAPPPSAPVAPAPQAPPAMASAPTPPPPSTPGGVGAAEFGAAVQKYASVYGAKGAKARFAEMAAAFGQPGWVSTSAIPPDRLADVMPWFATA